VYAAVAPWAESHNASTSRCCIRSGRRSASSSRPPGTQADRRAARRAARWLDGADCDQGRQPRSARAQTYVRPFRGRSADPRAAAARRQRRGPMRREAARSYLELVPCASCHGLRLKPEALRRARWARLIHELTARASARPCPHRATHGGSACAGIEPRAAARQIQIGDLVLQGDRMPAALPARRGPRLPEPRPCRGHDPGRR
jgi:excinuclease ABC subunit A